MSSKVCFTPSSAQGREPAVPRLARSENEGRTAAFRTCSVSLSRRGWRARRRLKSRSRRSADPRRLRTVSLAIWPPGIPWPAAKQMPSVGGLADRPKALALSKLNRESWSRRSWQWSGTRTTIANVLVRRLARSCLRLRRSRLESRVSGFPSPVDRAGDLAARNAERFSNRRHRLALRP